MGAVFFQVRIGFSVDRNPRHARFVGFKRNNGTIGRKLVHKRPFGKRQVRLKRSFATDIDAAIV